MYREPLEKARILPPFSPAVVEAEVAVIRGSLRSGIHRFEHEMAQVMSIPFATSAQALMQRLDHFRPEISHRFRPAAIWSKHMA